MADKDRLPLFDERWLDLKKEPFGNLYTLLPNLRGNQEIGDLESWYTRQVESRLPLERVRTPLTDGKSWAYEATGRLDEEGMQIEAVLRPDGQFYEFLGMKVTKKDSTGKVIFEWLQPVKKAREKELELELLGEVRTLPINGILAVIPDDKGNLLMAADQEATAETPNQLIVRLPVQASAGKIAKMIGVDGEPQPNADKQLAQLLDIYGVSIFELLEMSEIRLLPPPEDTNLDIKHNVLLVLPAIKETDDLHQRLIENGERKWMSRVQQSALGLAGVTNSHTLASLQLFGGYSLLKAQ